MMVKKKQMAIGPMAYLLGLLIVAIVGIVGAFTESLNAMVYWALLVLGLIVGFMNIQDHEIEKFLLAGLTLSLASSGIIASISTLNIVGMNILAGMLSALIWFVNPAIFVVAIRVVLKVMED